MECGKQCPSRETLRQFASGRLTVDARMAVVTRLRKCEACRQFVDSLLDLTLDGMEQSGLLNLAPNHDEHDGPITTDFWANQDLPTEVDGSVFSDSPAFQSTDDPRFMGRIGAYEVVNVLGRGGMGLVYLGFDVRLQRLVAIKVLQKSIAERESSRRQFLREARSAAAINHPNVVTIHDVNSSDEAPFLVMEYIPDGTLRQQLSRGGGLRVREAMFIGEQVARGLAEAHRLGVVHRDIKPGNVMLKGNGQLAKITDFGLACSEAERQSNSKGAVGTAPYMSPEQALGRKLTTKSDIFSFGCLLYAMLQGDSPFKSESALDSAQRVVGAKPAAPLPATDGYPKLNDLVMRCLAKAPDDRPDSMDEVADALLEMLHSRASSPTRPPLDQGRAAVTAMATFVITGLLVLLLGAAWRPSAAPQTPTRMKPSLSERYGPPRSIRIGVDEDFNSLGDALAEVTPNSIITVTGEPYFNESITISGERFTGLELRLGDATIDPSEESAILIADVEEVNISGGILQITGDRYGIRLERNLAGLSIDGMKIEQVGSEKAAVLLHGGAHGESQRPIHLHNMDIRCQSIGVICHAQEGAPVEHVLLENCLLRGVAPDRGTLLIMDGEVADFEARHNRLCLASRGLSFQILKPNQLAQVSLHHNTMYGLEMWLTPLESEPQQDISIRQNLVLECTKVDKAGRLPAIASWFGENLWENQPSDEAFRVVSTEVYDINVVSRNWQNADFLAPNDERLAEGERWGAWPVSPAAPTTIADDPMTDDQNRDDATEQVADSKETPEDAATTQPTNPSNPATPQDASTATRAAVDTATEDEASDLDAQSEEPKKCAGSGRTTHFDVRRFFYVEAPSTSVRPSSFNSTDEKNAHISTNPRALALVN